MPSDFIAYISSPTFTFVVGKEKKRFTVHSEPMMRLSAKMKTLMDSATLDEIPLVHDWSEEVDEQTFLLLYEFAYRGDYAPPECGKKEFIESPKWPQPKSIEGKEHSSDSESTSSSLNELSEFARQRAIAAAADLHEYSCKNPTLDPSVPKGFYFFYPRVLICKDKRLLYKYPLKMYSDLVAEHSLSHEKSISKQLAQFAPTGNFHPANDFGPVFLGHLDLYFLAGRYEILALQDLVLLKIAATLALYTLCEESVHDVLEFARISYYRTQPGDRLRSLIMTYMATSLGQLGEDKSFVDLVAEGGDFTKDIWNLTWKMIPPHHVT